MSVFGHAVSCTSGGLLARGGWKAQWLRASGGGSVAALAADAISTSDNAHHTIGRDFRVAPFAEAKRMSRGVFNSCDVDQRLGHFE